MLRIKNLHKYNSTRVSIFGGLELKKLVFLSLLVLFGCKQELEKEQENNNHSFYFLKDKIIDKSPINREWHEGFDLDKVDFEISLENNFFKITNRTPRYIFNPKLFINSKVYQIDSMLSPFEEMKVSLEGHKEEIKSMSYIDEQPMFKADIAQYGGQQHTILDDPKEENAFEFEQEMRGLKLFLNDFDFNVRFAKYIDGWHAAQANPKMQKHIHKDGDDCGVDFVAIPSNRATTKVARANDNSSTNAKHLSLLAYEPRARYMLLNNNSGSLGVATVGNGWLSVKEPYLFKTGRTTPNNVYFHEKMHNHGFGHSGGLTYGVTDELFLGYVKQGLWYDDFFDTEYLVGNIPTAAPIYSAKRISNDTVEITVHFLSGKVNSGNYTIDKILIIPSDKLAINNLSVLKNGKEDVVLPLYTHAEGKTHQFGDDLGINIYDLDTQKDSVQMDTIVFQVSNFIGSGETVAIMGTDSSGDKLQANLIIELDATLGFVTDTGTTVFTEKAQSFNNNEATSSWRLFTPDEAIRFCQSKGLELGDLPASASDKIRLQHKYLQYQSQVGVDPNTGLAQAYRVPTGVPSNTGVVSVTDRGALVICQ